jgi:hypothetical protein
MKLHYPALDWTIAVLPRATKTLDREDSNEMKLLHAREPMNPEVPAYENVTRYKQKRNHLSCIDKEFPPQLHEYKTQTV